MVVLGGACEAEPEVVGSGDAEALRVNNAEPVEPCAWPSVVAMLNQSGSPGCSGALIDPTHVLTAAHCINDGFTPVAVALGEDARDPAATLQILRCDQHPAYDDGVDLAVCELTEPAPPVQVIPPLQGCELEALREGAATLVVGFGKTQSWSETNGEGLGLKRHTVQAVYGIREGAEEIDLVPVGEPGGGCHGDSGGPAFIQLADGTWRQFGVAESLFTPPYEPPKDEGDGQCGYGTTYTLLAPRLGWVESLVGDVTPCLETYGSWDPLAECPDFPLQPAHGHGTWQDACLGPVGGEPRCEPIEGGTSSGGDWDVPDPPKGPKKEVPPKDEPEDSGVMDEAPEPAEDEPEEAAIRGGCTAGGRPSWLWAWLLLAVIPGRLRPARPC